MTGICIGHGGDLGSPSGGTNRVTAIAAGLAEARFDVVLVVPMPTDSVPPRLDDVELVSCVDASASAPRRALAVTRTASRIATQRGMTLQLEHSSLAGFGTLQGQSGYVLDMHDLAFPRFEIKDGPLSPVLSHGVKWLEARAVRNAAHIIVVSERMQSLLREYWDISADDVSVVPNGYFAETIEPHRGTPVTSGRVAFLGTLHPKVDEETLAGIAELAAVDELYVIGDGAKRERLTALADSHPALKVTGRLPDEEAFELVASAEAVVNPQTMSDLQRSSSPVKLYYYAALGKPIVATPGPSVVEELVANDAALAADSRAEFIDHVETILDDPALAQRLRNNALACSDAFSWDRRVNSVEQVLGDLQPVPPEVPA